MGSCVYFVRFGERHDVKTVGVAKSIRKNYICISLFGLARKAARKKVFELPVLWILPLLSFIYVIYKETESPKDGKRLWSGAEKEAHDQEIFVAKAIFGAVFLTCVIVNAAIKG